MGIWDMNNSANVLRNLPPPTHPVLVQFVLVLHTQQAVGADEDAGGPVRVIDSVEGGGRWTHGGLFYITKGELVNWWGNPFTLSGILTAAAFVVALPLVLGAFVTSPSSCRAVARPKHRTTGKKFQKEDEELRGLFRTHQWPRRPANEALGMGTSWWTAVGVK